MTILDLNDLALALVAKDFSPRDPQGTDLTSIKPNNGGPTKTSRALAIIHLAAHDAYAKVTKLLKPRLNPLPNVPEGLPQDDATGTNALLSAGFLAAERLYPDFASFITAEATRLGVNNNSPAGQYGRRVAEAWLTARGSDNSNLPQFDTNYSDLPGRHRPDPTNPTQSTLGRNWGQVKPFVLSNVATDAPLPLPPPLNSQDYATAFDQVAVMGRDNIAQGDVTARKNAVVGIFWGYDGSINLGTPPRLYNQVVRAILKAPTTTTLTHAQRIKILTAINVAMADAGIAAWYWKYQYDFWRPVVGIREADMDWGPLGKGDGNTLRREKGNPFWLPLGAPVNNPPMGVRFNNVTPGFPAYPSGHSTFGSACFETAAALLGKRPEDIKFRFVSDEFDGKTRDNNGVMRPKLDMQFSLRQAIMDNEISRIYLGVHWIFDATGGRTVGEAIARKVVIAFRDGEGGSG
jgi:membrane-associated phospholipid phosphatase